MRVSSERYRAERGAGGRLPPVDLSADTLGVIALELAPLRGLAAAPYVAEAVGALAADVRAGHSASTLPKLRSWAARWQRVRADLRAFYEEEAVQTSPAGNWGLYRILSGLGTEAGPRRGELDRMWTDRNGSKAPFTMIPKVEI